MHKDAFNSLSIDEKADLVFQKDSFVDTRGYYGQTISLYLVNGFCRINFFNLINL